MEVDDIKDGLRVSGLKVPAFGFKDWGSGLRGYMYLPPLVVVNPRTRRRVDAKYIERLFM